MGNAIVLILVPSIDTVEPVSSSRNGRPARTGITG
jgi:hypothetical protein